MVKKGQKITKLDFNSLIEKFNSEASRRNSSLRINAVTNEAASFDKMNSLNIGRIEISQLNRSRLPGITKCIQRSDNKGTPTVWDGRDLTKYAINKEEAVLAVGNKLYASQFNVVEQDLNSLIAMCSCNSYFSTYTTTDSCSTNIEKGTIAECFCQNQALCVQSCSCVSQECMNCYNVHSCSCESQSCSSNCKCDDVWVCDCDGDCGCDSYCGCNQECTCEGHCDTYACYCQSKT